MSQPDNVVLSVVGKVQNAQQGYDIYYLIEATMRLVFVEIYKRGIQRTGNVPLSKHVTHFGQAFCMII